MQREREREISCAGEFFCKPPTFGSNLVKGRERNEEERMEKVSRDEGPVRRQNSVRGDGMALDALMVVQIYSLSCSVFLT